MSWTTWPTDRRPGLPPPLVWLLLLASSLAGGEAGRRAGGERAPPQPGTAAEPGGSRPFDRGRRQAVRGYVGMESSTPANPERAAGSSQYPWAIVWGPTAAAEDGRTDPTAREAGLHPRPGHRTTQALSGSTPDSRWINLGDTPATLQPFLFGRASQGIDPQLYVTVTVSVLIVLAAISIILKFCWDRNGRRGHGSTRSQGVLTEESCQALTGPGPGPRRGLGGFFGPHRDRPPPRAQSPDSEPTSPTEVEECLEGAGKGVRFQQNRIPLVNL